MIARLRDQQGQVCDVIDLLSGKVAALQRRVPEPVAHGVLGPVGHDQGEAIGLDAARDVEEPIDALGAHRVPVQQHDERDRRADVARQQQSRWSIAAQLDRRAICDGCGLRLSLLLDLHLLLHLLLRHLLDLWLRLSGHLLLRLLLGRLLDLRLHPLLRLLLLLFGGLVSLLLRCVARRVHSGRLFLLRGSICLRRDGRGRLLRGTVVAATTCREQQCGERQQAQECGDQDAHRGQRTGGQFHALRYVGR